MTTVVIDRHVPRRCLHLAPPELVVLNQQNRFRLILKPRIELRNSSQLIVLSPSASISDSA